MIDKVLSFFKIYCWAIFSGILMATSYIPWPPWALFFCLIPFFHFCLKNSQHLSRLILGAWICQFVFTLIGFHWLAYTIHVFGFFTWSVSILLLLLFCMLAHIFFPLCVFVWYFLIRLKPFESYGYKILSLVTCFSLGISFSPMLFKWNLGYPWLFGNLPAFQTAELWGFEFLSTLCIFLQIPFLLFKNKKIFKISLSTSVCVFILLNFIGFLLLERQKTTRSPDTSVNVLMVQHNIGNVKEYARPYHQVLKKISSRLIKITKKALRKNSSTPIDFILWSEGAYPYTLDEDGFGLSTQKLLNTVKKDFKTTLVTGASFYAGENVTNSVAIINPKGRFDSRYDKHHLLAFGEYIPGDRWFPSLSKYFLGTGRSFLEGKEEAHSRKIGSTRIGFQICYESLFPSYARVLSQNGVDIFVNITNDSWYGSWYEPYQNLYMSIARSIEFRKPMIRLTNTGISTVFSATGHFISPPTKTRKIWSQVIQVPYTKKSVSTFFETTGYYINFIFLLLTLILPILHFFLKEAKKIFLK